MRDSSRKTSNERAVVEEEKGENNLVSEGDKEDRKELGGLNLLPNWLQCQI